MTGREDIGTSRVLIATENNTVDSVVDATGDEFVPGDAEQADDVAEMRAVEERLRMTVDALVVGRLTFEAFCSYWP